MKVESFYSPYKRFLPTNELAPRRLAFAVSALHRLGMDRAALRLASRYEPVTDSIDGLLGDVHLALGEAGPAAARYARALCRGPQSRLLARLREALEKDAATEQNRLALTAAMPLLEEGLRLYASRDFTGAAASFGAARRAAPALKVACDLERRAEERERFRGRFCENPFTTIHVNAGGRTTACCSGWLPVHFSSLLHGSRESIWNGPHMRAVRESILDGSFRYCDAYRCPHLNGNTLPMKSDIDDPELRRIIDEGTTRLPSGPRRIALNHDPSCNLACPSCRPEIMQLTGWKRQQAEKIQRILRAQWLPHAKVLKTLNSGDPLSSPMMRTMLRELDPAEHPDLRIQLITNAQAFTPSMWESLEKIHDRIVELEVSVDAATEETYSVVRRGGKFSRLLRNFELIRTIRERGFLPRWTISFVVQNRNFREMPDFVRLGKRFGVDGVVFKKILPRGPLKEDPEAFAGEFRIHDEQNAEHDEFLAVLREPILSDAIVNWHNLADEVQDDAASPT